MDEACKHKESSHYILQRYKDKISYHLRVYSKGVLYCEQENSGKQLQVQWKV